MASLPCALGCGKPVNPHDISTWKEVTGFVGGPKKDSQRLRTDTGRYAHDYCVRKASAGQAPDQPTLDEVDTITATFSEGFSVPEITGGLFDKPEEVSTRDEPDFSRTDPGGDDTF